MIKKKETKIAKDKPLSEKAFTIVNWDKKVNWTEDVAEAVNGFLDDLQPYTRYSKTALTQRMEKRMGNFNQDVKKDKGCGCTWYDSKENKLFACISTHLCPKCEEIKEIVKKNRELTGLPPKSEGKK